MKRTYCTDIKKKNKKKIKLFGWINNIRNHGKIIFLTLRDYTGICHAVIKDKKIINLVKNKLQIEYVIKITGTVVIKPDNKNYEVFINTLKILNYALSQPFKIHDFSNCITEEIRLKYRYLDLRRPIMFKNLKFRSDIIYQIRKFMHKNNFIEVETPMLTKSTPEGARDYLLPSRKYPGKFFALPQSPQLFKQILMSSGIDKYYQITKCFRDEDLRSDRQPEFTQLDIECAFIKKKDIINSINKLIKNIIASNTSYNINIDYLSYQESIKYFGSDKPDLRIPFKIQDIKYDLASKYLCNLFHDKHDKILQYRYSYIILPNCNISKEEDIKKKYININDYKKENIKIFYIYKKNNIFYSNIIKEFSYDIFHILFNSITKNNNDLIIVTIGEYYQASKIMGLIRCKIAYKNNILLDNNILYFAWVDNFPLFKIQDNKLCSVHHPFTMPLIKNKRIFLSKKIDDILTIKSESYDLVLNGIEIGGGSIRIHKYKLQMEIFKILNMINNNSYKNFDFLLNALEHGTPPHGGFALGIDRFLMILKKMKSIRDVIAFPKTQNAICLMTNSPK